MKSEQKNKAKTATLMLMADFHPRQLGQALQNSLISTSNLIADLSRDKPKSIILELTGSYPTREQKRKLTDFPPQFGPKDQSLEAFEQDINDLCNANWLESVIIRFEGLSIDLVKAYVLREQLSRLKEAGKQLKVITSQLGMSSYYLASIANEIILPESAELNIFGFAIETNFLKDVLGRFGVEFEKVAIKEYKNAGDNLTRSRMSEPHREQLNALFDGFQEHMYSAIASARNVETNTVHNWIDSGISSAQEALKKGLIDQVKYEDEILQEKDLSLEDASRFLKKQRRSLSAGRVAVISLEGTIMTGKSRRNAVPLPLVGDTFAGSESIIAAFRQAENDDSTKAIVFFIDSGGGSALASDLMWREVKRIAPTKPIIAVMGQYAASGGYYVLTHANKVIAAPTTLTGSIGVVSVKPITEAFNQKYGITTEIIQKGRYANAQSSSKALDPEERALFERSIAEVYDRFISRVAEGRKLSKERVNELGRGRVWTGSAAKENGLVDELGDIFTGIKLAKELANLKADAPVYNVTIPKKFLLPKLDSPEAMLKSLNPLLSEKVLLMQNLRLSLHS